MQKKLNIGGIGVRIHYPEILELGGLLKNYVAEIEEEIEVNFVIQKEIIKAKGHYLGEDIFCRYYEIDDNMQIELKGANNEPSAMIFCEQNMKKLRFELYEQMQNQCIRLDKIVALLPIRQILNWNNGFLFHASRIEVEQKAILFTGPSGIGKTTHANLWETYENAVHLCNDRTIIRSQNGHWNTYGYYEDGSEPIANSKQLPLGAIVMLMQDTENSICRINGTVAVKNLIQQVFLDRWDYKMFSNVIDMVTKLLDEIPVYCLRCRPDKTAVKCLKDKLTTEGVIG